MPANEVVVTAKTVGIIAQHLTDRGPDGVKARASLHKIHDSRVTFLNDDDVVLSGPDYLRAMELVKSSLAAFRAGFMARAANDMAHLRDLLQSRAERS